MLRAGDRGIGHWGSFGGDGNVLELTVVMAVSLNIPKLYTVNG